MKNIYFDSPLINYANKTYSWFSTDTIEQYSYNIKNRRNDLIKFEWLNKQISYSINSLGFRGPEFNQAESIIFLGCSHTLGIGLKYEDTWPCLVSSSLNLQCINLATNGSSNDTAFRMAFHYVPEFKPKIVMLLSPAETRLEVIENNKSHRLTVHDDQLPFLGKWKKFYQSWVSNNTNTFLNREKNILAIREICKQNSVKFLYLKDTDIEPLDLARDLKHFGKISNINLKEKFLNLC
jgi:hypothetical protein